MTDFIPQAERVRSHSALAGLLEAGSIAPVARSLAYVARRGHYEPRDRPKRRWRVLERPRAFA
jgi:hypothetical protein